MWMILFILIPGQCFGTERVWQWSNALNIDKHWEAGRVPCPGQDIVLPGEIVFAPENMKLGNIYIAEGGELILSSKSSLILQNLSFTNERNPVGQCQGGSKPGIFISRPATSWLDPSSWISQKQSPIPHAEQVPCRHDTAVFPPNMAFKVALHENDVTVGSISVAGRSMSGEDWRATMKTRVAKKMFNFTKTLHVTGKRCNDPEGCLCGNDNLLNSICSHATSSCEPASCSSPLKPSGHCCWNICGAVVNIKSGKGPIYLSTLQSLTRIHIGDSSNYHISRVSNELHQVIVVPKVGGNLTRTILDARKLGNFLLVEMRGRNDVKIWVDESGTGGTYSSLQKTGISFTFLVIIAVFSFLLYNAWNQQSHQLLSQHITKFSRSFSQWQPKREDLTTLRSAQAPFQGFAKFDNTQDIGSVEIPGLAHESSIVELDPSALMAKAEELTSQQENKSFENPMFNIPSPPDIKTEENTENVSEVENPLFGKCIIKNQLITNESETADLNENKATKIPGNINAEKESSVGQNKPASNMNDTKITGESNAGFDNPLYCNTEESGEKKNMSKLKEPDDSRGYENPLYTKETSEKDANPEDITYGVQNPLYNFELLMTKTKDIEPDLVNIQNEFQDNNNTVENPDPTQEAELQLQSELPVADLAMDENHQTDLFHVPQMNDINQVNLTADLTDYSEYQENLAKDDEDENVTTTEKDVHSQEAQKQH